MYKELLTIYEYLFSIRKLEKYLSFDIKFPSKWEIPKSIIDSTKVVENETKDIDKRFFSFVSDFSEKSIESIIHSIRSIIKYNKEREEKERLFKSKVNELKMLFDNTELDGLKQLTFELKDDGKLEINPMVRPSESEG